MKTIPFARSLGKPASLATLWIIIASYNAPPQTIPAKERPYLLPGLSEDAPAFRATIKLDRLLKRADAFNKSTSLKRKGTRVEATVSDIHEVLQLRC